MNIKKIYLLFVLGAPLYALSQNVGIGTNTPTSPLTVAGNGSNKGIIQKTGDMEVGFFTSTTGAAYVQTWSEHDIAFATNNGSARLTIKHPSGNVGIGINEPVNKLHVIGAATSAQNAVIYANNTANVGSAVYGYSNSDGTTGVTGLSGSGTGVYAYSGDHRAVSAVSPLGSALYGNSMNGYALEVLGKVKISGGNTNPSEGAVLTSLDASGNAVWVNTPKVGFKAFGISSGHEWIPDNAARRIQYGSEAFDNSNNYALLASGATATSSSSVFTAPVAGIYHFDVGCYINQGGVVQDIEVATVSLIRNRNGIETVLAQADGSRTYRYLDAELPDGAAFNLSVTELLQQGDRIYVNIFHISGTEARILSGSKNWFSGSLITPL